MYQLLCLRSFVDRGHRIELFSFEPKLDLPNWINLKDAAEILPKERVSRYLPEQRRVAVHADLFRLALLHRLGGWWVDPDVVLLRAALPTKSYPIRQVRRMGVSSVTVGTIIADRPPYRSVRAELPHTAPTSDE